MSNANIRNVSQASLCRSGREMSRLAQQQQQPALETSPFFAPAVTVSLSKRKALAESSFLKDAEKINSSDKSKTTDLIPDFVIKIQKKWSKLSLSGVFIKDAIKKLHKLEIEGLREYSQCENFIHTIYLMAQHRGFFQRHGTPSQKLTKHIEDFLEEIGYAHQYYYTKPDGTKAVYCGYVSSDKEAHGFGVSTFANGTRYEGNWQNGDRNGFGILTEVNGDVYEGNWQNGAASGFGIYTGPRGRYEGSWQNGAFSGFGIFTGASGRYEGSWQNGDKSGFGFFLFNNSARYAGYFQNGVPNHFGILTEPDGTRYEGSWGNGIQAGFGIKTKADGTIISQGVRIGDSLEHADSVEYLLKSPRAAWNTERQEAEIQKEAHPAALKVHQTKVRAHYAPHIVLATDLIPDLVNMVIDFL